MSNKVIYIGLGISLVIAFFLSPFASPWPDGLEKVAQERGFIERAEGEPALHSPVPDYAWPGIGSDYLATGLAGVLGTLVVFACGCGIGALVKRRT